MHFETGFYSTSCEDWTTVEDSSQWGLQADNSQFYIRGAVMGFLKIPLFKKTITRWKTGSNPLYPSSYKPPISLLPVPQLDVKITIWRGLKV